MPSDNQKPAAASPAPSPAPVRLATVDEHPDVIAIDKKILEKQNLADRLNQESRELRVQRDKLAASITAAAKLDAMSPAERDALFARARLAQGVQDAGNVATAETHGVIGR